MLFAFDLPQRHPNYTRYDDEDRPYRGDLPGKNYDSGDSDNGYDDDDEYDDYLDRHPLSQNPRNHSQYPGSYDRPTDDRDRNPNIYDENNRYDNSYGYDNQPATKGPPPYNYDPNRDQSSQTKGPPQDTKGYDRNYGRPNQNGYPSNYKVVPAPGYKGQTNCVGSNCCFPKCFAEKGSRVS